MNRTLTSSLVALAALTLSGAAFGSASSRPSIHVQPSKVRPGARIHIYGSAGSCSSARLTAISGAFPGHAMGQGTLTGRVRPDHTYSIRGRIRAGAKPGAYLVGVRCGGGNLGVAGVLRVKRG